MIEKNHQRPADLLRRLRLVITLGALLIALAHVLWPALAIDAITLVLIVVAVIPWLTPVFKSLQFPGGWKVEFQELQQARVLGFRRAVSPDRSWAHTIPKRGWNDDSHQEIIRGTCLTAAKLLSCVNGEVGFSRCYCGVGSFRNFTQFDAATYSKRIPMSLELQ